MRKENISQRIQLDEDESKKKIASLLHGKEHEVQSALETQLKRKRKIRVLSRELVALAIQHDEALAIQHGESMLQIPLETGLIHNQKLFSKALTILQRKQPQRRKKHEEPNSAPTPIAPLIVGGFLAQEAEAEDENDEEFTDLVSYCIALRRAALTRVRNRKRRSNIKRRAIPGLVLVFLLFSLVYTIYDLKRLLLEYGFVESCETMACRLAEFQLWQKLNSNPVDIKEYCTTSQICTVQDDSAFYAMHTIASTEWIPLDETEGHGKRKRWHSRKPTVWFGESVVNRLVRENIITYQSQLSTLKIADIGCGIGGSYFSFLSSKIQQFYFYGISISAPEIYQARRLLEHHQLDETKVQFHQQNFDVPLNQTFSTMLAIESLSYSTNLNHTLNNLASALQSKGVMIIVDDVLTPWAKDVEMLRNASARPSLLSHEGWKWSLASNGFIIKDTIDLTLEFDVLGLSQPKNIWFYQLAAHLSKKVELMYGQGKTKDQKAYIRTIQLIQDFFWQKRAELLREKAYNGAHLSYYMYVCSRK